MYYEPVGCYRDDLVKPRPLPEMLQTERDYTDTEKWNKILINWEDWDQYSPEMICRCAYKARMEGKDYFGIQFWGKFLQCFGISFMARLDPGKIYTFVMGFKLFSGRLTVVNATL